MIQRLLNFILRIIVRREIFITLNIVTLIFCIYSVKDIFFGIRNLGTFTPEQKDQLNDSLDGLAGIMVAIGVFMEERETIQKISGSTPRDSDQKLNEIAHHNGLGLLLIGLFMEIFTLMIESPRSIINTKGWETYLYGANLLLIVFAILIVLDFIVDYGKSYLNKSNKIVKNH